ncbi:translocation/assembly module TamB domain-containing protein [Vibrio sp. TH_r3]|uniref:autotransporter assembly complex protein TamB n=1 Tax=Vibrio sp. TH_r3 TaxID=3082084 RepID=UPI0029550B01|nr:translocation/assembly module TamB domain-containing protein [Vibrio sp. TH_r3]MDV7105640.1 translocation/assembly module TamB domain-containing protein [Vibrio sp. TH_r3]
MSRLVKWLLRTVLALFVLILLILTLLVAGLSTNSGLNTVIWSLEKVLPELQIADSKGSFFPQFSLYDVKYKNEDLNLTVESKALTLGITPKCFLTPSVCVELIQIDGLDVVFSELPPSNTEEPEPPSEPLTEVQVPFPIYINELKLTNINLNVLGNVVDWKTFSSKIAMVDSTLTLYPTLFEQVNVELTSTNESNPSSKEQSTATEKQVKQDIVLPDILVPLEIDIQQFDLKSFTLKGETPVVVNHLGLSANVHQYNVNIDQLVLDVPQADVELSSKVDLKDNYPLTLDAKAQVKQTELKGQKLQLSATGSVADLQLDSTLSGVIELAINGQLEPLKSNLPFDFALSNGAMQWPLTGQADYVVDVEQIKVAGSLDGYHLNIATVVDGESIPELDLAIKGDGNLNEITLESLLIKTLGGEVSGQVIANWQSPINWQATLGLKDIQPGMEWEQAEGIINGSLSTTGKLLDSGGWLVDLPLLDINGNLRDYPLDIEGQLSASDPSGKGDIKIETEGLGINHGPNGILISGKLDEALAIDTLVNIPDIEKSIEGVKGSISGTVSLRGSLDIPQVITDISATEIEYLDLVDVANLKLSSNLKPLPSPDGNLDIEVREVLYQGKKIDNVELSLSGTQTDHQLSLDLLSDLLSTDIRIQGGLQQEPELAWKGVLENANLSTQQGTWRIDHQVDLGFIVDSQLLNVQAHCWLQSNSKICLTEDLSAGQSGDAHLAVENFSFNQLDMFIPPNIDVDGEVALTASASWSPNESPNADVTIQLPQGNVLYSADQPLIVGWESIAVNAQLHNDKLLADWQLDITDNGDIKGNITVEDVQSIEEALDAQLILDNINLDMIQPLLGEYSKVNADIHSDIKVSGPVKHPSVNGQFTVDNIIAQGDITPVEVLLGKLQVDFSGYDALLDADIETADGVLKIDGDANWRDLQAWNSKVRVFAEELNVELPPMVDIKVKPDMTIIVNPQLAKIEGDIYLPWGEIVVEELPPSAVSVSSDEVILDKNLEPIEAENPIPMAIETDVNIHIGDEFTLAAFGLEGELVGQLNVTEKDKGPFIVGEIEIVNGTYRSFGQDLIIEEGKVLMNGPADQPYLAIEAVRNPDNTQDDVVAGIRVTGPANEPSIEVYSEPSMPQQNALSYLLRGQDLDASSGGNGMTTALIGLSIAKSGRLVGQIGETFGVSDLQLDTAGSGDDSQVTVSGYITPELQLKYGVGIFDSFGEFTVRYKLLTDLYLEAVSGVDSAVDLLYQFEFD